jgi:hypothetical protein
MLDRRCDGLFYDLGPKQSREDGKYGKSGPIDWVRVCQFGMLEVRKEIGEEIHVDTLSKRYPGTPLGEVPGFGCLAARGQRRSRLQRVE